MIKEDDAAGPRKLLEQFDALRVVFALDLFVCREGGVLGGVVEELKAILVEGGVGASAEVLNFDSVRIVFPVGGALASSGIDVDISPGSGPVGGWEEIFECSIDEVGFARDCHVCPVSVCRVLWYDLLGREFTVAYIHLRSYIRVTGLRDQPDKGMC